MSALEDLLSAPVHTAAPGLLGRRLVSDVAGERVVVILTEVEAYGGDDDPASHAHRGPTRRNRAMFEAAGTLYVYRSYGIHWCANVVCAPQGVPAAVLLRGGRLVEGAAVARRRRGRADHLCDGPGRLAKALGITGDLDGGSILDGPLRLEGEPATGTVVATRRVGITRATEREWRWVLTPGGGRPVDNPRA